MTSPLLNDAASDFAVNVSKTDGGGQSTRLPVEEAWHPHSSTFSAAYRFRVVGSFYMKTSVTPFGVWPGDNE